MPRIDWEWLAKAAKFDTERDMWHMLYIIQDQGCIKLGEYLGVSHMTILNRLRYLGYQIKPKGGANNTVSPQPGTIGYRIWEEREKIKDMTIPEMQGLFNLPYISIMPVLYRLNLEYKRRKNRYCKEIKKYTGD